MSIIECVKWNYFFHTIGKTHACCNRYNDRFVCVGGGGSHKKIRLECRNKEFFLHNDTHRRHPCNDIALIRMQFQAKTVKIFSLDNLYVFCFQNWGETDILVSRRKICYF